jgi:hypothetical protein
MKGKNCCIKHQHVGDFIPSDIKAYLFKKNRSPKDRYVVVKIRNFGGKR